MSNKKSFDLNGDILFLGKKIKFSNEAISHKKIKKNKFKIDNNKKYLTRPITHSEYFDKKLSNLNEKESIYQNFDHSEKEKNKILQSSFCFICGSLDKDNEYKYLINPLQKWCLINELKKLDLKLARKRDANLLNEEQSFSELDCVKNVI